MKIKGIIPVSGKGSRLYPLTNAFPKPLIPVYNQPMVYYPIATLMLGGVRDFVFVISSGSEELWRTYLGPLETLGLSFEYVVQSEAKGPAHAVQLARSNCADTDKILMTYGDNLYISPNLEGIVSRMLDIEADGFNLIAKKVPTTKGKFADIDFDEGMVVSSMIEKPENPVTNIAGLGLMAADQKMFEYMESMVIDERLGEYYFADVCPHYIEKQSMKVVLMGENDVWADAGTFDSLLDISNYVKDNPGMRRLWTPYMIAEQKGWVSAADLSEYKEQYVKSGY